MLEKLLAAILALTAAMEKLAAGGVAQAGITAHPGNSGGVITVETVREKMKELMDKKGKEAVVTVLAAVGAKKLGDISAKPEVLAVAYQKAGEALAAPTSENLFA